MELYIIFFIKYWGVVYFNFFLKKNIKFLFLLFLKKDFYKQQNNNFL